MQSIAFYEGVLDGYRTEIDHLKNFPIDGRLAQFESLLEDFRTLLNRLNSMSVENAHLNKTISLLSDKYLKTSEEQDAVTLEEQRKAYASMKDKPYRNTCPECGTRK